MGSGNAITWLRGAVVYTECVYSTSLREAAGVTVASQCGYGDRLVCVLTCE